jgi:hypothetical protein
MTQRSTNTPLAAWHQQKHTDQCSISFLQPYSLFVSRGCELVQFEFSRPLQFTSAEDNCMIV